ncbi:hypothetical protein RchiOBHm_Chr2g0170551 [Rosa chinensis]|uniref:Uncharacterized protein n=1 Tax=Rosa chinensis TaxID=74649 RepID=A0A2P6S544_ROSCH|nr:hypothetical protein RchiOBHm_Chr2g0170551 [Rosa chinensis]
MFFQVPQFVARDGIKTHGYRQKKKKKEIFFTSLKIPDLHLLLDSSSSSQNPRSSSSPRSSFLPPLISNRAPDLRRLRVRRHQRHRACVGGSCRGGSGGGGG